MHKMGTLVSNARYYWHLFRRSDYSKASPMQDPPSHDRSGFSYEMKTILGLPRMGLFVVVVPT